MVDYRIQWDKVDERVFETGIDRVVVYDDTGTNGVPWNGVTEISESTSGGDVSPIYLDGLKVNDLFGSEDFSLSLSAIGSPDAFNHAIGRREIAPGLLVTQQNRTNVYLTYRTMVGDPVSGLDLGYKLHLVYNASVAPSGYTYSTTSDTPSPVLSTWTLAATPPYEDTTTYKPSAHLIVDSRKVSSSKMLDIENMLYGQVGYKPTIMPQPWLVSILQA